MAVDSIPRIVYTWSMKLVAQVKLVTTEEQRDILRRTLAASNALCDWISERAWTEQVFGQYALHHLCYHEGRAKFGMSAQATVRAIAKVADAYKLNRKTQRHFRPEGSATYDLHLLSWKPDQQIVNIWTVEGRIKITFVCGERQAELLKARQGESDLCLVKGEFYLNATCDIEPPDPRDFKDVLGVDLGVVNIATTSDGTKHSGKQVNHVRGRHRKLRAKLQRKGTKSCKRKLRKLAGKERRFASHVNHCISRQIVDLAQRTERALALEDLLGIRARIRARRQQRAVLHSWSFAQLRQYIEYKAAWLGITVVAVDPRNTSRTCPVCGHIDKANRPSQSVFRCQHCGHAANADVVGAVNIAALGRVEIGAAVVSRPNVSGMSVLRSA